MCNEISVLRKPVQIFVKIPPTMLGKPVRTIQVGKEVKFVAVNTSEEILVTAGSEIVAFDKSGKQLYSITNKQLRDPSGLAVKGSSIYVVDNRSNVLLKFDKTGKLLKSVGQRGSGKGEFRNPFGLTVVGDEVIVCDFFNSQLQVFTSDLV